MLFSFSTTEVAVNNTS